MSKKWTLLIAVCFFYCSTYTLHAAEKRPNIIWIVVDDMSANFGCYGEKLIETPHLDAFAKEGTLFKKAFTTAPVCSPCRSALITGCYQTNIGAHHHRSGRGEQKIVLPKDVVPVPALFQAAGYYTCIGGYNAKGKAAGLGKTDYNFEWNSKIYNSNDWAERKPNQPFFMQVQLHGGKHRGQVPNKNWQNRIKEEFGSNTDPNQVQLPPYYPRDPVILQDWADYLDTCRYTDKEVGNLLDRLKREKLLDETIIFFMTDHGISHARGKQFLYDEGIHIPFIVRGPGIPKNQTRNDLIEHIDMTATSLALASIPIPSWMQGKDVFAKDYQPKSAVFSARDRCDETIDHIRSVRTQDYKYIRNYLPKRPMLQPCSYKDSKAILKQLRELHSTKMLSPLSESLLFSETRPEEELYDLKADRFEIRNLAHDPSYLKTLVELRQQLQQWEVATNDHGRKPEPLTMYQSDMDVYLKDQSKSKNNSTKVLEKNIELNLQWLQEGK